jgi:hypothetical protein
MSPKGRKQKTSSLKQGEIMSSIAQGYGSLRITRLRREMAEKAESVIRSKMSPKMLEYFLEHPAELERVLTTIPEKEEQKGG